MSADPIPAVLCSLYAEHRCRQGGLGGRGAAVAVGSSGGQRGGLQAVGSSLGTSWMLSSCSPGGTHGGLRGRRAGSACCGPGWATPVSGARPGSR